MKPQVTKESLAQWIAELESQPHLSLREERYLAVMQELNLFIDTYGPCDEDEYVTMPDEVDTPEKFIEWVMNQ